MSKYLKKFFKSASKIRDFGLKAYFENKIFKIAKEFYITNIAKKEEGYAFSKYRVWLKENWDDTTFIFCHFGTYGRTLSRFLESYKNEFIFLDIGSNQGLYSLVASKNIFCKFSVAYEPVKSTYDLLTQNIKKNDLTKKIKPIKAAISSKEGKSTIYLSNGHSGMASLSSKMDILFSEDIDLINHTTLNEHLSQDCDILIKVDVEGHEKAVINEIIKLDKVENLKIIFYEINEKHTNPEEITGELKKIGFNNFKKLGSGDHYDVIASK